MRYTIKNLRCFEHLHGIAWKCDILLDATIIGECDNDGRGGCNRYVFNTPKDRDAFERASHKFYASLNNSDAFLGLGSEDAFIEKMIATELKGGA